MKMTLMAADFSSKLCYKVFHIETDSKVRNACARKIKKVLQNINVLNTPTVEIKTDDEVIEFLQNNPEFKLDGKGWDPNLSARIYKTTQFDKGEQRGWQYGPLGIWASNYTAWKNFVESDYEYLLLMEDDIYLDNNFLDLATKYINQLPDGWEIFHMYAPQPPTRKAVAIGEDVSLPYQCWSLACYFLTKEGAKKLLAEIAKEDFSIYLPADWHFFRRQNILTNMYTVRPFSSKGCRLANVPSSYFSTQTPFDMSALVEKAKNGK